MSRRRQRCAVQVIGGLPGPLHFPPDGDLAEAGVLAADAAVGVVEGELHRGHGGGLAGARALEDDVGAGFPAEPASGTLNR